MLAFVQNFIYFDSQPLETAEWIFLYIYRRLYSHLYGPMSQVLHPTCPKISNFQMLDEWSPTSKLSDIKLSHIPDDWYIFFYLHENPPVCHTCFWNFQIFSRVFPWLNFEHVNFVDLGVSLRLSTFCFIFPKFLPTGKKAAKKCFPKLRQKYPSITKSFKGKCNFSNSDTSVRKIEWVV